MLVETKAPAGLVVGLVEHYLAGGQGDPDRRTDSVHDLAIGYDGRITSMDAEALTRLINNLRFLVKHDDKLAFDTEDHKEDVCAIAAAAEFAWESEYAPQGYTHEDVRVLSNRLGKILVSLAQF